MEGRWGRRVNGSVKRGDEETAFHIEVVMRKDLVVFQTIIVLNSDLEEVPDAYGFILDKTVEKIDERIKNMS